MNKSFKQKNKFIKGRKILSVAKGFTLVETLVAISIFTMSILALLSVLTQGISNTNYAKQKMVASYLAQEGIEYIKNMRDTSVLYNASSQAGWDAFNTSLTNALCGGVGCYIDDSGVLTACGIGGICPALKYDATAGKYNYTTGTATGYIRKITKTTISANETKIFSTVFWTRGSGSYNIVFSDSLFNWVQ